MQIRLLDLQFPEVHYKVENSDRDITKRLQVNFTNSSEFPSDFPNRFNTIFHIIVENEAKSFQLRVKAVAHFETDEPINEEFKASHFPRVNAPAIAYPFLRAFLANFVLSSGYNAFMLAAINFQKRAEEEEQKK